MMLQLNPPIPVETPKGKGMAQVLIDYGAEHDVIWLVFQDDTGEAWCWNNKMVKAQTNITFGRDWKDRANG
jgi:hypothetical protein